jgi:hypothetical protein
VGGLEAGPEHPLAPFLKGERSSAHYGYAKGKIWVVGGNVSESVDPRQLPPWGYRENVWIPHSGFVTAPDASIVPSPPR